MREHGEDLAARSGQVALVRWTRARMASQVTAPAMTGVDIHRDEGGALAVVQQRLGAPLDPVVTQRMDDAGPGPVVVVVPERRSAPGEVCERTRGIAEV